MPQVKKLSVATVYGKVDLEKLFAAPDKQIHVMRVIGQAVGSKSGESNYGPWTALTGRFRATNPETGEVMEAAQLFLPEVALIPIQVAMSNGAATFAIDVFAKKAESTKPGGSPYEYTWEPLIEPTDDDPLTRLQAQVNATKALSAPTPAPAPAPAPAKGGKGGK